MKNPFQIKEKRIVVTILTNNPRGGGVLALYMTGESDGALYCEPKKIHEPEILHPKNTWHQNFLPEKI